MNKNVPLLLRILSSSVSISKKAGSIINDIMHSGNLNIVDKVGFRLWPSWSFTHFVSIVNIVTLLQGINDLQTEADRSSQKCIVKSLMNQFPKVAVIGEEVIAGQFNSATCYYIFIL